MTFVAEFSQVLLFLLGVFLMIVILLQRGRGGGLAGAFGGLGGQSAFGTKAGDVFTKITVVIAVLWVVVSGGSGFFLRAAADAPSEGLQTDEEIEAASTLDDEDPMPGAGPLIPDNNSAPQFPPADSTEDDPANPDSDTPDSDTPDSDTPDSDPSPNESSTTEPTEGDTPESTDDGDSETPESSEKTDAESPTTDADLSDESSTENE